MYFIYQKGLLGIAADSLFCLRARSARLFSQPEYYILNNIQFACLAKEQGQIGLELEKKRGRPYAKFPPGINYSTVARHDFRNAWGNLPE
jgi:hypothetical protein